MTIQGALLGLSGALLGGVLAAGCAAAPDTQSSTQTLNQRPQREEGARLALVPFRVEGNRCEHEIRVLRDQRVVSNVAYAIFDQRATSWLYDPGSTDESASLRARQDTVGALAQRDMAAQGRDQENLEVAGNREAIDQGVEAERTGVASNVDQAGQGSEAETVALGTAQDRVGQGAQDTSASLGSESETAGLGAESETAGLGAESETAGLGAESETAGLGAESETAGLGAESEAAGLGAESETAGLGAESETAGLGTESETTGQGSESETAGLGTESETTGQGSESEATGASEEVVFSEIEVETVTVEQHRERLRALSSQLAELLDQDRLLIYMLTDSREEFFRRVLEATQRRPEVVLVKRVVALDGEPLPHTGARSGQTFLYELELRNEGEHSIYYPTLIDNFPTALRFEGRQGEVEFRSLRGPDGQLLDEGTPLDLHHEPKFTQQERQMQEGFLAWHFAGLELEGKTSLVLRLAATYYTEDRGQPNEGAVLRASSSPEGESRGELVPSDLVYLKSDRATPSGYYSVSVRRIVDGVEERHEGWLHAGDFAFYTDEYMSQADAKEQLLLQVYTERGS